MRTKLLQISVLFIFAISACDKNKLPSVEERISKIYTVDKVTHDGIIVFVRNGTDNLFPGYSSFRLDMSIRPTVNLREYTSQNFKGTFTATDNTLTLTGLTPEPTNSGGTLTYTINSISDDGKMLQLTATSKNPKTSNTINVFNLKAD